MNNKRLISLTACLILATILETSPLVLADVASETDAKAERHFEKANELRKVADHDGAIAEYGKAISLSPKGKIAQDAQYWIGQSHFEARQFDAALSAFQKILDEYPASTIIPSTKQMMDRVQQAKMNKLLGGAAWDGDIEQVRLLISQGADVNARGRNGDAAIHVAAWARQADAVELLIQKGAEVDAKDTNGYTALYYAVWFGDTKTTRVLVANGADLDYLPEGDPEGEWPPLYYVLSRNEKDLVELMVEKGSRAPAFHLAAFRGDLAKVRSIYANGMDVDARDQLDWTPLHWAASGGQTDVAEFLVSKGADIKAETKYKATPLNLVASKELAELLLSKGLNVNEASKKDNTPLHSAAKRGNVEVAEVFISHGADIEARNGDGRTPLHTAVASLVLSTVEDKKKEIVEFLIAKGASVNTSDNQGRTVLSQAMGQGHTQVAELLRQHGATETLHEAVASADIDEVKRLISEGHDVNSRDNKGQTPLHFAANRGQKEILEVLLANGADIEARDGRWHNTALLNASVRGRKEVVELLLEKGANIEAKDGNGGTPLNLTSGYGTSVHTDVIQLLLDRGADIESRGNVDCTPLQTAVAVGRKEVAELLLAHGAKLNVSSRYFGTPAHHAMKDNHRDVVRWAISKGINIPPMHQAAYFGEINEVRDLLSKGADVNHKDLAKFTAMHCAVLGRNKEIVQLLIDRGADLEARSCGDTTPLFFACRGGYLDIVKLLLDNGADVNGRGWRKMNWGPGLIDNWSNLHIASFKGHIDVVEHLLGKGADIHAKCTWVDEGLTQLHLAAKEGRVDVVKVLLAKGADASLRSKQDRTALDFAKEKNHTEVIQLLQKHSAKE